MATSLHLVLENFAYQISSITPTETRRGVGRFMRWDPLAGRELPSGTGGLRQFFVEWAGSDADGAATNINTREAWHVIRVAVHYPTVLTHSDLMRMVLLDRHDVIGQLRDPSKRVGYDAAYAATGVGLMVRIRRGDTLQKTAGAWSLVMEWRTQVRESEA